jgi:hypothetical protein
VKGKKGVSDDFVIAGGSDGIDAGGMSEHGEAVLRRGVIGVSEVGEGSVFESEGGGGFEGVLWGAGEFGEPGDDSGVEEGEGEGVRELSLFSGVGGGLLGTKLLGWRTVGYVEWDDYCQRVLRQRIEDRILDEAPIFGDIRAFIADGYAGAYQGLVDVITAGFPCQPFSVAGKRRWGADERNMWPQTIECIRLVRPRYALLENVPGLLNSGYFPTIIGDLSESGYDAKWCTLSAAEVGAPHKRDRLWIVAQTDW